MYLQFYYCLNLVNISQVYLHSLVLKRIQSLHPLCSTLLPSPLFFTREAPPLTRGNTLLETPQGGRNPIFSTAPTVQNNRLLFTSSMIDRWSNWLRLSTRDMFLVNTRLSIAYLTLLQFSAMELAVLEFSPLQNLVELRVIIFVGLKS